MATAKKIHLNHSRVHHRYNHQQQQWENEIVHQSEVEERHLVLMHLLAHEINQIFEDVSRRLEVFLEEMSNRM